MRCDIGVVVQRLRCFPVKEENEGSTPSGPANEQKRYRFLGQRETAPVTWARRWCDPIGDDQNTEADPSGRRGGLGKLVGGQTRAGVRIPEPPPKMGR